MNKENIFTNVLINWWRDGENERQRIRICWNVTVNIFGQQRRAEQFLLISTWEYFRIILNFNFNTCVYFQREFFFSSEKIILTWRIGGICAWQEITWLVFNRLLPHTNSWPAVKIEFMVSDSNIKRITKQKQNLIPIVQQRAIRCNLLGKYGRVGLAGFGRTSVVSLEMWCFVKSLSEDFNGSYIRVVAWPSLVGTVRGEQ